MRTLLHTALFAALGLTLAGCTGVGSHLSRNRNRADGGENAAIEIGQPAPEIEGTDSDSRSFKLSDYRGKVVLLDFWRRS